MTPTSNDLHQFFYDSVAYSDALAARIKPKLMRELKSQPTRGMLPARVRLSIQLLLLFCFMIAFALGGWLRPARAVSWSSDVNDIVYVTAVVDGMSVTFPVNQQRCEAGSFAFRVDGVRYRVHGFVETGYIDQRGRFVSLEYRVFDQSSDVLIQMQFPPASGWGTNPENVAEFHARYALNRHYAQILRGDAFDFWCHDVMRLTPSPSATSTTAPSATATSTNTPAPSATIRATSTIAPSVTSTNTPRATNTASPSATARVTATSTPPIVPPYPQTATLAPLAVEDTPAPPRNLTPRVWLPIVINQIQFANDCDVRTLPAVCN
jgi:hypothetical protein